VEPDLRRAVADGDRLPQRFVALAEELNFTRAAARVNVVQQVLSAGVAQLETLVGARLFERTTRRVRMTAAGEDFLPRAREALPRGRARGPPLHLHRPYAGLLTGETDVAIVRPPFATALELHEVAHEPRYVTLPSEHPLAGREEIAFAEIADEPWMDTDTDPVWCAFWTAAEHRTRPPRIGAVCRSIDELFEAARVGRACGMVPESVARSRAWPGLAFVRVADVEPSIAAVACRPGESRQAVRNFLALAGVG
jgi:DNA-binding transcriptional LysR family regulator